jgi:uncharacterized protein YdaU (DUF1376 family)
MPAAAFGALARLCLHYWATECRPLPRDDESLMQIARAHRPTWRHHKAAILETFDALAPALDNERHRRRTRAHHLIEASAAAQAARKAARIAASLPPRPGELAASPAVPQRAPPKPLRPSTKATHRFTD